MFLAGFLDIFYDKSKCKNIKGKQNNTLDHFLMHHIDKPW